MPLNIEHSLTPNQTVSDNTIEILNRNTIATNRMISDQRAMLIRTQRNRQITNELFNTVRSTYIPELLREQYDNQGIRTIGELVDFIFEHRTSLDNRVSTEYHIWGILNQIDNTVETFDQRYPAISNRSRNLPIQSSDIQSIIQQNGINVNTFIDQLPNLQDGILGSLETNFSGDTGSIMGQFCSLVNNVFDLVNGQTNYSANPAEFAADFLNIANSISPRLSELTSQFQQIQSLIEIAQDLATNGLRGNLQEAFSTIASSMDIIMNFFNSETPNENGSVTIVWDKTKLLEGIQEAIDNTSPGKDLFLDIVLDNYSLGDINQSNSITSADKTIIDDYFDDDLTNQDYIDRIELMLSYMSDHYSDYYIYDSSPVASETNVELITSLQRVQSMFGSPSAPNAGDFGANELSQSASMLTSMLSNIQSVTQFPMDVSSLLGNIDQLRELSITLLENAASDFQSITREFVQTVESALATAEENSVSNPTVTQEITAARIQSISIPFTEATQTLGQLMTTMGPELTRELSRLQGMISNLAAVGVLDQLETQISSVANQAMNTNRTGSSLFSGQNLDNGFNFNMGSSFGRLAGLVSRNREFTSEPAQEHVQDVLRGQIANTMRGFRHRNREETDFASLRFCGLSSEISRIYAEQTRPMEQMQQSFSSSSEQLSSMSRERTETAIAAGATRLGRETRIEASTTAETIPATIARPHVNPDTGTVTTIPTPNTPPRSGYGPVAARPIDMSDIPTYEQVSQPGGLIHYVGNRVGWQIQSPGNSMNGLHVPTLALLVQLARAWGNTLTITSAYDPPSSRSRRSQGSQHRVGRAFDIRMSSRAEQLRFFNLAFNTGNSSLRFHGFGSYNPFLHIDTGPLRSWRGSDTGGSYGSGYFRYYELPGENGNKR